MIIVVLNYISLVISWSAAIRRINPMMMKKRMNGRRTMNHENCLYPALHSAFKMNVQNKI